ncbi:MAG: Panacea domain-containing protein [Christensenellales bacterium]
MPTIFDVAKYILSKKGSMSTMKLQKLCYYSKAWSMVWDDDRLFNQQFQAWTNGPVCKDLFDAHKGRYRIDEKSLDRFLSGCELTEKQKSNINNVLDYYGKKDSQWLSTLTHMEKPWNEARIGYSDGENCEKAITEESMKRYYGSL